MLTALAIRDVVLIDSLALEFGPGLSALTGETGAGKSILLDSLGLALGARGDPGLVRAGQAEARVSATFELPGEHPAVALLADNALGSLADGLIVRRLVKADGGSRAWVNDQPVSAGLLRELGALLVEVHGQHDERGLLARAGHRALLDRFGALADAQATVAAAWSAWRAASARLVAAQAAAAAGEADREWLEHASAELAELAPERGEDHALSDARAVLQKGARLGGELDTLDTLLGGGDGAVAKLRQATRRLERLAGEHGLLADALAAADRALDEAARAEDALVAARKAMDADPARLETVEARLFALRAAARKHKVDADALPALAADLAARATALDAGGAGLIALAAETAAARAAYLTAATALTNERTAAAARLDAAVATELPPLKLDAARFRTELTALVESGWGETGVDAVEFTISTNPGAPFGPLARVASGGELSRLMLALKVALADTRAAATLIFDEIDRGVGGAVASAVGERLARLGGQAQVLCVTHSPQVAARAGRQWLIEKRGDTGRAVTAVRELNASERREEIARMLSAAEVTPEARAQAARLLG